MKYLWMVYTLVVIIVAGLMGMKIRQSMTHTQFTTNSLLAPLPKVLNILDNSQVNSLTLWLPQSVSQSLAFGAPAISAKSALLFDMTTGKTLFAKSQEQEVPMASLTKIMTAIIALENKKVSDEYLVTGSDIVGEDSMGVTGGEVLSSEELLYGLILNSGNDAAEVFASNYQTGREGFIKAMNDKVLALGLSHTHFSNPSGLEGDGSQYTTAYDLLVITNYALTHFPEFVDVVGTYSKVISATSTHKEFDLYNETNLLTSYPGVKGIKTGYTPEAGYCLATYLEYGNHKIIGILFNSDDRRKEMKELLDYSLQSLGITPPLHE